MADLLVPETANRQDWPRLVARAVNPLGGLIRALAERATALEAVESFTGWAVYEHGGGAQSLPAATRTQLSIDGASKIESQLPPDTGPLWDTATDTIVGRNGDAIVVKIQCTFTPDDATASNVDFEVDIGGSVGVVEQQSEAILQGAGIAHRINISFVAYTLGTWEANGGEIYAIADGPGDITNMRILINRTHKAKNIV